MYTHNARLVTEQTLANYRLLRQENSELAVARGYEREACGNCGEFALVREGTLLICDACGEESEAA